MYSGHTGHIPVCGAECVHITYGAKCKILPMGFNKVILPVCGGLNVRVLPMGLNV